MTRLLRTLAALAAALVLTLAATPMVALAADDKPQLTEAQCYEVMDQDGNVLASHDADRQMAPASITKIMTAMVALDSGKSMDDTCTITDLTYTDGAQLAGYTSADTPTFRQLMMAMLVYSANDAASNVAINVSGDLDTFVAKMNEKAKAIGMTHTHFQNPHGLEEDGHYSCAHDLALMGRYALEHYPFIAQAVTTRQVTLPIGGSEVTLPSTDDLMGSYAGLCGIKTGAVASGTTFLGSSKRHGIQLFSCVLGCSTHEGRFTDTKILMDWVYDSYLKRIGLARKSWIVRLVEPSLGFWGKRVVTAQWDAAARVYGGRSVTYSTAMPDASLLFDAAAPYGTSIWRQEGRPVAREAYQVGKACVRASSWNVFCLPLFYDVNGLVSA